MNIGVFSYAVDSRSGGVGKVVLDHVHWLTTCGGMRVSLAICKGGTSIPECPEVACRTVQSLRQVWTWLREADVSVLHIHGAWLPMYAKVTGIARMMGIPVVTTPHGMFEPYILNRNRWKKTLAVKSYEGWRMRRTLVVQALSHVEQKNLQTFLGEIRVPARIDVIPNGLRPRDLALGVSCNDRPYVLFLSRIHEKKGLFELVEAWGKASRTIRGARCELVVAGWGESSDEERIRRVTSEMEDVRYIGAIHGQQKWSYLEHAEALILPSKSEGLPMVVLEAWAARVPVVLSDSCKFWQDVGEDPCLLCKTEPESISGAIRNVLALEPNEKARLVNKAAGILESQFSMNIVGARLLEMYRSAAQLRSRSNM